MPVDPYSPCSCGSGKKAKFCCADLMDEMEKIERMLAGEQRVACLAHVNNLLTEHPGRASLLGIKGMLQRQLGLLQGARETIDALLAAHPSSLVGLAENAMLLTMEGDPLQAIPALQNALEAITDTLPLMLYEAIGVVGHGLLVGGEILSAVAHLQLQAGLARDSDNRARLMLLRLGMEPRVPLLLKEIPAPLPAPAGVPWAKTFEEGVRDAMHGCWRRAEQLFLRLLETNKDEPSLWRNVAWLRLSLADRPGGVAALRTYASCKQTSLDEAVEAEALAQLLDSTADESGVEMIQRTCTVRDSESFEAALRSDSRVSSVSIEQADWEGPPPRGMFLLLNRPLAPATDSWTLEDIPQIVGTAILFGRETDRPARLEMETTAGDDLKAATTLIERIGGDGLGTWEDEVVGRKSLIQHALSWRWRLPDDMPPAQRRLLSNQKREATLLHDWPRLPLKALGGKTPLEASHEPALRTPLLAAILLLDLDWVSDTFDFNTLREALKVPLAEPIDSVGDKVDIENLPLGRLARLDAAKLDDEALLDAYTRAVMYGASGAARKLAAEVIGRESLEKSVDKAEAHGLLARFSSDPSQAREHVQKARRLVQARNESCAPWDFMELDLLAEEGKAEEAAAMLQHLVKQHAREPGVAERLRELIGRAGGAAARDVQPAASTAATSTQTTPSGLWTPESAAPQSAGKSKLWVPGME